METAEVDNDMFGSRLLVHVGEPVYSVSNADLMLGERRPTSVRINSILHQALKRYAKRSGMTESDVFNLAVQEFLQAKEQITVID